MDLVAKSPTGFEYLTKLYISVNWRAKGNGTLPDTEMFMVKTYCEPNKAATKAASHEVIESDLALSHKFQILKKRTMTAFGWLFVEL